MAIEILLNSFCFMIAAMGFGMYFNTPKRALLTTGALAFVASLMRALCLHFDSGIVLATLAASSTIGILAIQAAHSAHVPQVVLSMPALIPLVPGAATYKMMKGFVALTRELPDEMYVQILNETIRNSLNAVFVTLAIAIGVAVPMLITRQSSGKHLHLGRLLHPIGNSKD